MPIAEPSDPQLWPRVRALTGWPDSDEDALRALSSGWRGGGERFARAGGYDVAPVAEAWPDAAGQAFQTRAGEQLRTTADLGARMGEMARMADTYAAEVMGVKAGINALIQANAAGYAQIAALAPEAQAPAQAAFVQQVAAMVDTMMRDAADRIAAAGTGAAPVQAFADWPPFPPGPPVGGTPDEVRAWWDGLSDEDRETYARGLPDAIRNLDGIPASVRHEANLPVLAAGIAGLEQREREITGGTGPPAADGELDQVRDRLTGLRAIDERLRVQAPGAETLLLGLDTTGDGRAIVAVGNPDTARNVATLVPGIYNDLGDVGPLIDRAGSLRPGADTSSIAWLGYDTPDMGLPGFGSVLDDGRAEAAKADLARFQEGLRTTHNGEPSHNTVVAHSYGTTVAGQAARDFGLAADDLILVASTDPGVDNAGEYRLDGVPPDRIGEHVHATAAPDDALSAAGTWRYGNNPTDREFGARVFETAAGGIDPHSASFDPGSARDEIRRIIEGR
ncbi:WXG100-like domain-containing protein [Jidongwangia harbinensis]|uniref:WXG100-like domain-containing protein n=1 Tax=Jidongwangia harbinensis TaxID=2878561 RepID=UPI001CD922B9|nr:alpha/beta hydrolase [Jidongwangia harbinensis]MCA2218174.1 alpha/beta hydrolase family protein [Jidongwangia harbinensis]